MQFFTLAATTLFAGLAMAAPAEADARSLSTAIKFEGAADAAYTIVVPVDGQYHETYNSLSISHINVLGANYITCTAKGVDGSVTTVRGGETKDVGPPQTQTKVACSAVVA
ncbi:hypothetical protein PG984_000915 [Apiospora sp. TS-2023a]